MTNNTQAYPTTSSTIKFLRLVIFIFGPLFTLQFLSQAGNTPQTQGMALMAMLLWSPLFFSIPALLMQNQRDKALYHEKSNIWRGVKLIPYLLLAKTSTVKLETLVSLVAWFFILFVTKTACLEATSRLFSVIVK
jgi:hypothetical protein